MAKQAIQTDLLGQIVRLGPQSGTFSGPSEGDANELGRIRNVYLDKDGEPKYTLQMLKTGHFCDYYHRYFYIEVADEEHRWNL